jgi:membrane protease YdiL (CAAX protease family)
MVLLAALTAMATLGTLPATFDLGRALPLLGLAVLAALMNAFVEEVVYRSAPLSQLAPVIGGSSAVVLLAIYFGLGHFYGGIPSGPVGAVMSGAVGLLFGRAMLATRGLAWPWALHFSIDLVIYAGIALVASSGAA